MYFGVFVISCRAPSCAGLREGKLKTMSKQKIDSSCDDSSDVWHHSKVECGGGEVEGEFGESLQLQVYVLTWLLSMVCL